MKASGIMRFATQPVLSETPNGTKFSEFRLVFHERIKNKDGEVKEDSHFFDFKVWASAAEIICKFFNKGEPIYVVDSTPRQESWVDKESGKKRSAVYFRLNDFEFLPSNKKKETNEVVAEQTGKF